MKSKQQNEMKPSWNFNPIQNTLKYKQLDAASINAKQNNNELDHEIDHSLEVWEEFRSFCIHG
jgi:hypothetical protein